MRKRKTILLGLVVCAVGFLVLKWRAPELKSNADFPQVAARDTVGVPEVKKASETALDETKAPASSDVCEKCSAGHPGFVCSMYGGGRMMRVNDLPPGKVRSTVEKLSVEAQKRALLHLSRMNFRSLDEPSVRVDGRGAIYYVCSFTNADLTGASPLPAAPSPAEENPVSLASWPQDAPAPITSPPIFHSKPGSAHVLFLDFNGHDISNTAWNVGTVTVWRCTAFDSDGDNNTFSAAEQRHIREIWERVSEDYAVFDVDVTTEQPTTWTRYTAHALITPTTDAHGVPCPHAGLGGIAYLRLFWSCGFFLQPS